MYSYLSSDTLEVRPVYHKTDNRIRSHVFLCTLAYYLQWHANVRLQDFFAAVSATVQNRNSRLFKTGLVVTG